MKKVVIIVGMMMALTLPCIVQGVEGEAKGISINKKNFPEKSLRVKVKSYDDNKNGKLERKEVKAIKSITIRNREKNINCKGLSKCKNISAITLSTKGKIRNYKELSKVGKIKKLKIKSKNEYFEIEKYANLKKTKMTVDTAGSFILRNDESTESVEVYSTKKRKYFEIVNNKELLFLSINANKNTTQIKIEKNSRLQELEINDKGKETEHIRIANMEKLKNLELYAAGKTVEIEVENLPVLNVLCLDCPVLKTFDWDRVSNITYLSCKNIETMSFFDFEKTPDIQTLRVESDIEEVDVRELKSLKYMEWHGGKLKSIKIPDSVFALDIINSGYSGVFDLNQYPNLKVLYCDSNKIEKIIATNHKKIYKISCGGNDLKELQAGGAINLYTVLAEYNSDVKLHLHYPESNSHTRYCYDESAKVSYEA